MTKRPTIALLLAFLGSIGGCGSSSATCVGSCEQNDWPRAVIWILPPEGYAGEESTLLQSVVAETPSGLLLQGTYRGCPVVGTFFCSYSFTTAPGDKSLRLRITLRNGQTLVKDMELAEHNYCGREIAAVRVIMRSLDDVAFGEPQYVSPCSQALPE